MSWHSRQVKNAQVLIHFCGLSSIWESTTNGLQTSKPKLGTEGNHSLVVQEEAWKDFLLLLKDSKAMAVLMLDLWKANKQIIMVQVHRPTWQHCLPLWKTFPTGNLRFVLLCFWVRSPVNIKLGFPKCKHHRQAWTASLDSFLCVWTGTALTQILELVAASSAPLVDVLPQLPGVTGLARDSSAMAWLGTLTLPRDISGCCRATESQKVQAAAVF